MYSSLLVGEGEGEDIIREEFMRITVFFLGALLIVGCTSAPKVEKETALPDFDKLWDYSNPAQTEIEFRKLVPLAEKTKDISYYTQLVTQIARTLGLQQKFEAAHALLDTVEPWLTEAPAVSRVRYLLERGRAYNSSGHPDKAKPLFLNAWELAAENNEDYYAIDAIHMLQIVEPPDKQLEWAHKAMELAEKTVDERTKKWLGPLYNNTGWTYFDSKDYDNALVLFEKSLAWRQSQEDEQGTIIAKWCIARNYRAMGRTKDALEAQMNLENEVAEKGLDQDGYIYEEIGECLLELDRADEAKEYFGLAYGLLSTDEWLKANEPERLERLRNLSE
jgi:tetratricopeptide (TPR) repeat protein